MALMMETEEHHDEIACIVYDEYLYFTEAVATGNATNALTYRAIP